MMAETTDRNSRAYSLTTEPEEPDEPRSPDTDEYTLDSPASPAERAARNELEATEMAQLRQNYSRASSNRNQASSTASILPTTPLGKIRYAVRKFWKHQVSITVPHDSCRDHLALERTYLAYLRTSLILSMTGVLVSQLFRLQHAPKPDPHFGFFILGKPLACTCQVAALCTVAIGGCRAWRTQNAIVRGKALTGGFEIIFLGLGIFLILIAFFTLLLTVNIRKEYLQ